MSCSVTEWRMQELEMKCAILYDCRDYGKKTGQNVNSLSKWPILYCNFP